jgi:hypothetical protein
MDYPLNGVLYAGPTRRGQHNYGDASGTKILLVSQIRVGRYQSGEAIGLGSVKQSAVLQPRPSEFVCGSNLVLRQEVTQWNRSTLIEENAHLRGGECTSRSMLQYSANLFNGDTREPLHKLRYECTVLKILEQGSHRNARAREHPRTTCALGVAFDHRTCGPVDHRAILPPSRRDGQ